ncbi:MAG: bifunctional acetate--CoA ligase family protein/GNAT family N-acetyltransferase [Deltaproteobacteria bacterium]|nr:bifunctional acetate--CoA ligase family protein/GNAT family N-acetyltransferase [Deltaproteobacteria bacterium]
MSVRNLELLLRPRSIAVVGASNTAGSVGAVVMRNLLRGGFQGPVMPVHPRDQAVAGVLAYPDVKRLPVVPDLAVICTPPAAVPGIVAALADAGTRAAVVLTAGFGSTTDGSGRPLRAALDEAVGRRGFRLLGPNCLGLLVPGIGLDASFAHVGALPGELAFVSQSGAICTAVLDWAREARVGFSCFASVGDTADVDAADLLDWFGADPGTHAILLYLESLPGQQGGAPRAARKFLSAARAAARNKPVLVLKAGRSPASAQAALSHTGRLAGADEVFDAALRRAGMLRVDTIQELFDAAETLVRSPRLRGNRMAIVSNGGGLAVLATDTLVARGGTLAALAPATIERLDAVLPRTWSRANPVDLIGDADGARYERALGIVLEDPGVDVVLALHAPTAIASGEEAARAVARALGGLGARRAALPSVVTSWVGHAEAARRILREAGIASYESPDDAIAACAHLLAFRRNQELLAETPPSLPEDGALPGSDARRVIEAALAEGRELLSEAEAKAVLAAYRVPVVETRVARDAEQAVELAEAIGSPVALKILSPDVTHKSDVGGVALDLEGPGAVRRAAERMAERLRVLAPGAHLTGYTVQAMARRPGALELIAGIASDPIFGPVVLFGQGGTAVEVIADRAMALPPLNASLARELISRTRVSRLLAGWRQHPPADLDALAHALVQVAQIAVDLPEVVELDVNPLLADAAGVLALDARIRVRRAGAAAGAHLAIRPYPREQEETIALRDGAQVLLRPIRPEDEPAHHAFHDQLEPEDIRFRFFNLVRKLPHSQMARFTQIDYDREMAFLALPATGAPGTLGVVRTITDPDNEHAEFAIVVRSDQKGRGLGRALLEKMIRYCRARGTGELVGQVLPDNRAMLELAHALGFRSRFLPEDGAVEVRLALRGAGSA